MRRSLSLLALAFVALLAPLSAHAAPLGTLGDEPITLDVTNTLGIGYRFDNRNTVKGDAASHVDDHYGELIDRLTVQANWWRITLGLRFESLGYVSRTTRAEARRIAELEFPEAGAEEKRNEYTNQFINELHSRYLRTFYPAKLWVGYNQPGLDVTVGDFYAQLGRGLVLSVRKIDELAIDTTVRGVKAVADHDFGPLRLSATLLGGVMNPTRFDEVSGRRLHGQRSLLFFGFPEAGDLRTYGYRHDADGFARPVERVSAAKPSYLDDRLLAGRLELGTDVVQVAANGAMLLRTSYSDQNVACRNACGGSRECERACDVSYPVFSSTVPVRSHDTVRNFGGSVNLPRIGSAGDLYLEVVGQQQRDGHVSVGSAREADLSGYAVYASTTWRGGPLTFNFEGKHYRSFYPLTANIGVTDPGFSAPEFQIVAFSQPPTAEPIYVQPIGSPNICITGGRGRFDYRFGPSVAAYTWVGHYVSATELEQSNAQCHDRTASGEDARTRTWDTAIGTELDFERKKSHARAWVGARTTDRFEPDAAGSTTFYREGYVRYDLVKHLAGPVAIQAQGLHRRRHEPDAFEEPWTEGENYTALQWAPHFAFIFGYEYMARDRCNPAEPDTDLCHYVNGGVQWRSGSSEHVLEQLFDTVNVFVGQRRGAIRCVSGVCRFFPAFEGARVDIVSRF